MRTSAARALHLALFGLGALLYIVFVLPRWWVLTGDIPRTLATAGRIAAGIPIALAAWPVMQILKTGLAATPRPPELALRLRAWSGLLHVVAGALILLAAVVEIWLRLEVGAPWLFGVYGAAGAMAVLGLLALYLSFVAEQPPAAPKPPKVKAQKAKRESGEAKKPTTKRGRKKAAPTAEPEQIAIAGESTEATSEDTSGTETVIVESASTEVVALVESDAETGLTVSDEVVVSDDVTVSDEVTVGQPAALRNKRPAGKSRRRLSR